MTSPSPSPSISASLSPSISPSPESVIVDLDIFGLTEEEEDMIGGFVAVHGPRVKIILYCTAHEGKVILTHSNSKVKIFTELSGGTEVLNNAEFNVGDLQPTGKELYVEGIEGSADLRDITISLKHNLSEVSDSIKFTVVKVDFIRAWDTHQEANRTTRAIDPDGRSQKQYEDNARSDVDAVDNEPMLVLGAWGTEMAAADVKLKCQFTPVAAGSHILWKIASNVGSVNGNTAGNFGSSDTIDLQLIPSTEIRL